MKILTNELDPISGTVSIDKKKRMAKLNQDQFAYEDIKVSDCVIMGHHLLWEVKQEREHLFSCKMDFSRTGHKFSTCRSHTG